MSKAGRFLPLLYLLIAGIGWIAWGRTHEADANFVTYRFASNLLAGRGLLYWSPDPAISTYPLVPLLLSLLGLTGAPMPGLGGVISIVAPAVGAFFLTRLVGNRWAAGIAYVLLTAVQSSPVVLTMSALVLAGIDAARCSRWTLTGVSMGAAILTDPSALAPATLTLVLVLATGGAWQRYLLPAASIPLVVILLLGMTTGVSPNNLVSVVPGVVVLALPVIAVLALVRRWPVLRQSPHVAILVAWSAITALYALLAGTLPTSAILPGPIALASLLTPPALVLAAVGIDLILGLLLTAPYDVSGETAGRWIASNTGSQASVAAVGIGPLPFYAARPVIDLSGEIQSVAFDSTFFLRYAPDVVALEPGTTAPWEWFETTYAQVFAEGEKVVYQRVVNFAPLDDHGVDVNFSAKLGRADLRLSNVALGNVLHPGDLVRVRLDWELAYKPSFDVEIKLTLLNEQGLPVAGAPSKVPPEAWRVGKLRTYHLIVLPNDVPDGRLSLYLGVGIRAGELGELKVAEVSVAR